MQLDLSEQGMSQNLLILGSFLCLLGYHKYQNITKRYPSTAKVVGLFVYPVKSFAACPVSTVELTERGFKNDRKFMVIKDGVCVTQRDYPKMAILQPNIIKEGVLEIKGTKSTIKLENWNSGKKVSVTLFGEELQNAVDQGDEIAKWLRDEIGEEGNFRMVCSVDETLRIIEGNIEMSFADCYPILVTSKSSLSDLNRRIGGSEEILMERFRPNIVIEGLPSWKEDKIGTQYIFPSGQVLRVVELCSRCKLTTVCQQRGIFLMSGEPLKTLRAFRRLDKSPNVYFGADCVVDKGVNTAIKLGEVIVL